MWILCLVWAGLLQEHLQKVSTCISKGKVPRLKFKVWYLYHSQLAITFPGVGHVPLEQSYFLIQVRLRTEVPCTPSTTRLGFELMTSRSWQHIHVTEMPAITTWPSVTSPWKNTAHTSYKYASLSHTRHHSCPPGTHHCWVGRGRMEKFAQHFYTWPPVGIWPQTFQYWMQHLI